MSFKDRAGELAQRIPQVLKEPATYVRGATAGAVLFTLHAGLERVGKAPIASAETLDPAPITRSFNRPDHSFRTILAPAAGVFLDEGLVRRMAFVAPDTVELKKSDFPAVIDFTLKAIGKDGQAVKGAYYKVQGRDNKDEFYLYQAADNQSYGGDPSKYNSNTKVVARFTYEGKDIEGREIWRREALDQKSAVIYGSVEREKCNDICPDAFIDVTEVDQDANLIQGGEIDAFKVHNIKPYVLCDRWGNWYDNPPIIDVTQLSPSPIPSSSPTPSPSPTRAKPGLPRTGDGSVPSEDDIRETKPRWGQP